MRKDIFRHGTDALGRSERLLAVNGTHFLVLDLRLALHRVDVINAKRQHIAVVDGVHNRIGVELVAEKLRRRPRRRLARARRIRRENRRSRKAENMILLERLRNRRVHIAELRAMALIENQHDMLAVNRVRLVLLDEHGKLLNRHDDDPRRIIRELSREHARRRIAVRRALFKAVVLPHRLIVKILAINHEEHLVDIRKPCGTLRRLERSQRLARTRRVPDIAAALDLAPSLVIRRDLDARQNALRCRNLVRAHEHQHLFRRKDRVARQNGKQRMLGKERASKIHEIGDEAVARIRPKRRELKTVARLLARPAPRRIHLANMTCTRRIGIILRIRPIRNDENLHILIQSRTRPKTIALVAIDLIERLANLHAAPLQLQMHERQAIDENRHIIAVRMRCRILCLSVRTALHRILIDDLQTIVVNVLLIDQLDVLRRSVIAPKILNVIRLNAPRFLHNAVARRRDRSLEEPLPLRITESIIIERRKLLPKIRDQLRLVKNLKIRIAFLFQQPDQCPLKRRLLLIRRIRRTLLANILGEHRALFRACNQIVVQCTDLLAPSNKTDLDFLSQCLCNLIKRHQGRYRLSFFNTADVRLANPRFLRQFFLCQILLHACCNQEFCKCEFQTCPFVFFAKSGIFHLLCNIAIQIIHGYFSSLSQ